MSLKPRNARLLIIDSTPATAASMKRALLHAGYEVDCGHSEQEALTALHSARYSLVLCEKPFYESGEILNAIRGLSVQVPVLVTADTQTVNAVVEAVKSGAADFLSKPIDPAMLVKVVAEYVPEESSNNLIAADPSTLKICDLASRVAATDATVLISGPSGVGKEVFARYIHSQSSRTDQPFIALNCAAIPENMLEAMLFGYEKGAYTGAVNNHIGKFEQAQGGTLLLDEISEMDLSLQAKLLRVLQEKELERLGGKRTIRLNVRVLATTNRDLRETVARGEFREDLFYRLNVFPLAIPSLRARPEDIIPLARHFVTIDRDADQVSRLSVAAEQKLKDYHWPGNVRELDNVIQRALILQSRRTIDAEDIQFESFGLQTATQAECVEPSGAGSLNDWMRTQEHRQIENAIRQGGSKKEAAAILGISPRTLRYKLQRLREAQYAN
ncbi:two-component system response regulator FlrC [Litorivivens lipolytica]|uniref:Two-component system response regulator FlrC n=1 Tax=Litorivivens lipolytica TaxID=1524264 RepID=A0A7W4Z4B5_9GAMM|nr:sigma-54 dependent transcriptional regulator [Litorivivens lipolytica]MBB3046369.1 two-component system response regulator FlrC [Litorivivens lipolytica]